MWAASARYPWHTDDELAVLTRADVVAVLQRHRDGPPDADTVEAWADVVEGRDDIGYDDEVGALQCEPTDPDLCNPLTAARARTPIAGPTVRRAGRVIVCPCVPGPPDHTFPGHDPGRTGSVARVWQDGGGTVGTTRPLRGHPVGSAPSSPPHGTFGACAAAQVTTRPAGQGRRRPPHA